MNSPRQLPLLLTHNIRQGSRGSALRSRAGQVYRRVLPRHLSGAACLHHLRPWFLPAEYARRAGRERSILYRRICGRRKVRRKNTPRARHEHPQNWGGRGAPDGGVEISTLSGGLGCAERMNSVNRFTLYDAPIIGLPNLKAVVSSVTPNG